MALELLDDYTHEPEAERPLLVPVGIGKRIASMVFESMIIILPISTIDSIVKLEFEYIFFVLMMLLASKDIIGGKSLLKRLNGMKVVHIHTKKTPNPILLVLRNFTCLFTMVEVLALTISPQNRRIGDYLCRTIIVEDNNSKYKTSFQEDLDKTNWSMVFLALIIEGIPIYWLATL